MAQRAMWKFARTRVNNKLFVAMWKKWLVIFVSTCFLHAMICCVIFTWQFLAHVSHAKTYIDGLYLCTCCQLILLFRSDVSDVSRRRTVVDNRMNLLFLASGLKEWISCSVYILYYVCDIFWKNCFNEDYDNNIQISRCQLSRKTWAARKRTCSIFVVLIRECN